MTCNHIRSSDNLDMILPGLSQGQLRHPSGDSSGPALASSSGCASRKNEQINRETLPNPQTNWVSSIFNNPFNLQSEVPPPHAFIQAAVQSYWQYVLVFKAPCEVWHKGSTWKKVGRHNLSLTLNNEHVCCLERERHVSSFAVSVWYPQREVLKSFCIKRIGGIQLNRQIKDA